MNEGVPAEVLAKWKACKHDFVTSTIGNSTGIATVVCRICGYYMRTDKKLWQELKSWEGLP